MKRIFLYILAFAVVDVAISGVLTARTSLELAKLQCNSRMVTANSHSVDDENNMIRALVIVDSIHSMR